MRCIEISEILLACLAFPVININMRCIEIEVAGKNNLEDVRLTLTWDVLKLSLLSALACSLYD